MPSIRLSKQEYYISFVFVGQLYIHGTVKMKVHRKITPVSISHRASSCVNTGWFHGPRDGFDIHEN